MRFGDREWRTIAVLDTRRGAAAEAAEAYAYAVAGGERVLGAPLALSRTPAGPAGASVPGLGEHTEELLAEAGYGAGDVAALLDAGAVATGAAPA
jgi:crotonobetainyl-CoA:carnitine CoA-transferase CaiB-like acyl-CoA transferase